MISFRFSTIAVALACFVSAGMAADIEERNIKIGTTLAGDHPQVAALTKFGELLGQKSGGKLKVKIYPGGTLGNDVSMTAAVQGGVQEMAIPEASTLVGNPALKEFGLLNLPLLFKNSAEADKVLDGPFGKKLLDRLPQTGLIGLGIWENGFRHVTNSRHPINKVEDFAGLKIRVLQNPLMIDLFSTLGANAVPMPFPEVYPGLESKAVDGQENPFATIESSKFYEVNKHAVISGHVYSAWALIMGKKFWDKLSPVEQKLVRDAAAEATTYERTIMREFDRKALESVKAKGMQVTVLSDAERARMGEKLKPVTDKFTNQFGAAAAAELTAELARIRAGK
ncbi:MAG: ABC transporter substrate-binding protein [Burkholderiales bacterium PBB6]|nr:MAG: ABC transporter substrate-binding protein [Burkholderiales bacterium PBB6]